MRRRLPSRTPSSSAMPPVPSRCTSRRIRDRDVLSEVRRIRRLPRDRQGRYRDRRSPRHRRAVRRRQASRQGDHQPGHHWGPDRWAGVLGDRLLRGSPSAERGQGRQGELLGGDQRGRLEFRAPPPRRGSRMAWPSSPPPRAGSCWRPASAARSSTTRRSPRSEEPGRHLSRRWGGGGGGEVRTVRGFRAESFVLAHRRRLDLPAVREGMIAPQAIEIEIDHRRREQR